jgi:triphosphatase
MTKNRPPKTVTHGRAPRLLPQSSSQREIEVKLEGEAKLLQTLFALDALAGVKVHPHAQRLVTTYFDTKDDALDGAGIALRVRKLGSQRVMTLKWTPHGEGLFSRGEVETPLSSGDIPDLTLFDEEIAAIAHNAIRNEALIARFETRVRRRLGYFASSASRMEIAIDEGEIIAGERRAPIAECEVELKSGDPRELYSLAARLIDEGLRLGPTPKAQRGYRLARGGPPAEVRARQLDLRPEAPAEDAVGAIVDATLTQFLGNWPALLEASLPESIHQMRVSLRRLRSGLALFEKKLPNAGFERFRSEANQIALALGRARDQDAFAALVAEGPLRVFPHDESFEALLSASAARRERAYADVRKLLRAPETSRFVLELQAFAVLRRWRDALAAEDLSKLEPPARFFAADALERLDQRAQKRGKGLLGLTPEERHRLRIALKNLRYTADFFTSLFDDQNCARKFIETLGRLQDVLGSHNDAIVACRSIADLEREAGPAASRAAGIVLGWCGRDATASDSLSESWRAFQKARRFWRQD